MGQVNSAIQRIQKNDPQYTITDRDLIKKKLTDKHVQSIAQALCCKEKNGYGNTNLVWLNLGDNNISAVGAKALAHALASKEYGGGGNNTLKDINLTWNNIGDSGAEALAHALGPEGGNTSLEILNVAYNNITDKGIKHVADALRVNSSLKEINLRDNEITDEGAQYLWEALQENTSLTWINLEANPHINDRPLEKRIYHLVKLRNMKEPVTREKEAAEQRKRREENQRQNELRKDANKANSAAIASGSTGGKSFTVGTTASSSSSSLKAIQEATNEATTAEYRKKREENQRQNQPQNDANNQANSAAIGSGSTGGKSFTVGSTASSSSTSSSLKGTQEATEEITTAEHRKKRDEKQIRNQPQTNATNSDAGNSRTTGSSSANDDKSLTTAVSSLKETQEAVESPHNITAQEIDELRTHVIPYTQWAIHSYDIPTTLERENESKVVQFIETDSKMQPFYGSLNSILYDYFIAAMSMRTGDVTLNTGSKNKTIVSSLLSALLQGLPILSQVSSTLDTVVNSYVSLDMTHAMNNLLSVAPAHTEILESVQQLACNISLGLKDVHIDKLDSTRTCRGIWRQVKDRIMSKEPTNVYEEEGMVCGMAIVKLCMKGNVTSECFNAEELLHALGYDRQLVRDTMARYRHKALDAGNTQVGSFVMPARPPGGSEANETEGMCNHVASNVDSSQDHGRTSDEIQSLKEKIDALQTEMKEMKRKDNRKDMDVGTGSTAQQQLPSPDTTSTGDSATQEKRDLRMEEMAQQVHVLTEEVAQLRAQNRTLTVATRREAASEDDRRELFQKPSSS